MRLSDLDAHIYDEDGRQGIGVQLECPVHRGYCGMLRIPFKNPLDGGPPIPVKSNGCAWERKGDTIDNLTLTPSINISQYFHPGKLENGKRVRVPESTNCWHGFITNGEVT